MAEFKFVGNNTVIKSNSFNLRQTLDCGQAFRFSKDENGVWQGVVNNRVLRLFEKDKEIIIENLSEKEFFDFYYNYFTFDVDYTEIKKILSADETLKKAVLSSSGIRILKQEKFETVCSFIFSQNNNIPRIKGIIDRFCENFGERIDENNFSFPTAEKIAALSVEDLAPIRAGFRAKYIIDASRKIASGEIDLDSLEKCEIDTARQTLMKIKGVGSKVSECILLFSCKRFECFPIDVWMKKVMESFYPKGLPDCTKGIEGIAQQYLFDYARKIGL